MDQNIEAFTDAALLHVLTRSNEATAVYTGEQLYIRFANDAMISFWGKGHNVIGKPIEEAIPELIGQPFPDMLRKVWRTGETESAYSFPAMLDIGDGLKRFYFDFEYRAICNNNGEVYAILHTARDVTDRTKALDRLRGVMEQAPVGMCVLTGKDLVIEMANPAILKIWGRRAEDVMNKPHRLARPELQGQPVYQWLDDVYTKGIQRTNTEFRVMLYDEGNLREAFVNSIYQPIRDAHGEVTGVLVILDEITDQVKARRQAETTQEMLSLAIDAGELGAFYYNPQTDTFRANKLLKSWFGLQADDEISLDMATAAIVDADRARVAEAIADTLEPGSSGRYDVEYAIDYAGSTGPRMVRAAGKAFFDADGHAISLNGTLQDITERKKDEQRKNDFIGMVSHELKTPITSLNAYIQVLQRKAGQQGDVFAVNALDQAQKQVRKMTSMINGFLNVSRLESGQIHIDRQHFDLKELVEEMQEEITLAIGERLQFGHMDAVMVWADREKISQVIQNLISNAIKYSPPGTTIKVSCTDKAGQAEVCIKDQGIGIAMEDQKHLFERYYRVQSDKIGPISGFGIGLYLSKEIIDRHQGKIWVESVLEQGSSFCFSLPASANASRILA